MKLSQGKANPALAGRRPSSRAQKRYHSIGIGVVSPGRGDLFSSPARAGYRRRTGIRRAAFRRQKPPNHPRRRLLPPRRTFRFDPSVLRISDLLRLPSIAGGDGGDFDIRISDLVSILPCPSTDPLISNFSRAFIRAPLIPLSVYVARQHDFASPCVYPPPRSVPYLGGRHSNLEPWAVASGP